MTGFKLNHCYRLKKKYHHGYIARKLTDAHDHGRMTIHVEHYAFDAKHVVDGSVVDKNNELIIGADDYHCFTEYKPFKANGTYQLREQYVNTFGHTEFTLETFGQTAFTFTADKIDNGSVYVYTENGEKQFLIACSHERHMFKRIDNK